MNLSRWTQAVVDRFFTNVNKHGRKMPGVPERCWDWTGSGRTCDGTGTFHITTDGKTVHYAANRFVWEVFNGQFLEPEAVDVAIICGNYECCNPAHLVLKEAHTTRVIKRSNRDVAPVAPMLRKRRAIAA